jgi:hypothetical protein
MDKSELHAIAKLMGYRVVAVNSKFGREYWSAYVINDTKGVMQIINTPCTSEERALDDGWTWVENRIDSLCKGELL